MQTICITGGAGFIGVNLVRKLLDNRAKIRIIDDFSTGREINLQGIEGQVELYRGDLRDTDLLKEALQGVDVVYHQAAMPSVPRSMEAPLKTTDITLMGTVNLFNQAAESGVQRVVYASSSSIYGNQPGFPRTEEMYPAPESPYAASKAACELFGKVFGTNFPVETVGLRYFNVFGPYQDPTSNYAAVVPNFITAVLAGESPVIYGDGEQSRDFTYVQDVVKANIYAAEKGQNGRVYNVARRDQTTINQLLEMVCKTVGADLEAKFEEARPGDVRCSYGDDRLFNKETGFTADYSVARGVRETVEWYRENLDYWDCLE